MPALAAVSGGCGRGRTSWVLFFGLQGPGVDGPSSRLLWAALDGPATGAQEDFGTLENSGAVVRTLRITPQRMMPSGSRRSKDGRLAPGTCMSERMGPPPEPDPGESRPADWHKESLGWGGRPGATWRPGRTQGRRRRSRGGQAAAGRVCRQDQASCQGCSQGDQAAGEGAAQGEAPQGEGAPPPCPGRGRRYDAGGVRGPPAPEWTRSW